MTDYHLAMHGLAIRRASTPEEVSKLVGVPADVVEGHLAAAAESGRAVLAGEKYMLTPPAEMALRMEYSRFYGDLRKNDAMIKAYEQFEKINTELKSLITGWQTIEIGGNRVTTKHKHP